MTDHPVTPPPELRQQWRTEAPPHRDGYISREHWLMNRAAQWGADQELEACCEWMSNRTVVCPSDLRAARRPKPPSLKEQALQELNKVDQLWATKEFGKETLNSLDTIRRAIESIPDPS